MKKPKVFRRVYRLINSKIKDAMRMEEKTSKKLLNLHRNMAMQSVTENSRKSSRHSLKVLSDLGSRDSRKEKERGRVNNRRKKKRKML